MTGLFGRLAGTLHLMDVISQVPAGEPCGVTREEKRNLDRWGLIQNGVAMGRRIVIIPDNWILDLDVYTYTGKHKGVIL